MLDDREATKIKRKNARLARNDQLKRGRESSSRMLARKSNQTIKKYHTGKRRSIRTVPGGAVNPR